MTRTPNFIRDTVPVHGLRASTDFIVAHTTEGHNTVAGLASYFRGTGDRLGSSFLVTRKGQIGKYVTDLRQITYHVKHHNGNMLGIEQEGFAATSRHDWLTLYRRQLFATAWLMAYLSNELHIPLIVAGNDRRQLLHHKGVLQHRQVPDNDHNDCGTGYPMDFVLHYAVKWAKGSGPTLGTRIFIKTGVRPLAEAA